MQAVKTLRRADTPTPHKLQRFPCVVLSLVNILFAISTELLQTETFF